MSAHDVSHLLLSGSVGVSILLRDEVFSRIRNGFEEFDKIRWKYWSSLKWTNANLLKIVEKRLVFALGGLQQTGQWRDVFERDGDKEILERVFVYSIHGPRNALEILQSALQLAACKSKDNVSIEDVEDAVVQLAKEKIRDIAAFHEREFPHITDVIGYIFEGFRTPVSLSALESHIRKKFLDDPGARETFADAKWAFRRTARRLIDIFFEVGIVGYIHEGARYFRYDETNFPIGGNPELDVHPALKTYLLGSANPSFVPRQ